MTNYTAKTIEEILDIAAEEKGVTKEELFYNITDEKKGLLGIGNSVSADVFCMDDIKEFLFDYLGAFFTGIEQDIEVAIEEPSIASVSGVQSGSTLMTILLRVTSFL